VSDCPQALSRPALVPDPTQSLLAYDRWRTDLLLLDASSGRGQGLDQVRLLGRAKLPGPAAN
jgi:hypothetical protein